MNQKLIQITEAKMSQLDGTYLISILCKRPNCKFLDNGFSKDPCKIALLTIIFNNGMIKKYPNLFSLRCSEMKPK